MDNSRGDLRCRICGSSTHPFYSGLYDDRHGFVGEFDVVRCDRCKSCQIEPPLSPEKLPEVYTNHYPRKTIDSKSIVSSAKYDGTFFQRLKATLLGNSANAHYHARSGMRALDVGCGTGTSLIEWKKMGVDGYGTEYDANVRPLAQSLGLKIHFGDVQSLNTPNRFFDLITLNQVLEHIPVPADLLRFLGEKTKVTGEILATFPNVEGLSRRVFGKRWINWHVPYHFYFFSRAGIEKIARDAGLEVISMRSVTPNEWYKLQILSFLFPGRPGEDNPTFNPYRTHSRLFLLARKASTALGYLLTPVWRLLDLLGLGDNIAVRFRVKS